MKLSTSISAVASALLSLSSAVSATCFKTGADWTNANAARDIVQQACISGPMQGTYGATETKSFCHEFSPGSVGRFRVQNLNDHASFNIADADCYHGLWDQIACKKGGEHTASGWYWRADPDNGACEDWETKY